MIQETDQRQEPHKEVSNFVSISEKEQTDRGVRLELDRHCNNHFKQFPVQFRHFHIKVMIFFPRLGTKSGDCN